MKKNTSKDLTKRQSLLVSIMSLAAAYVLGSAALDTGSLWQYFFCLLALIVFFQHLIKATKIDIPRRAGHK